VPPSKCRSPSSSLHCVGIEVVAASVELVPSSVTASWAVEVTALKVR
jgi:hypothetical protein